MRGLAFARHELQVCVLSRAETATTVVAALVACQAKMARKAAQPASAMARFSPALRRPGPFRDKFLTLRSSTPMRS